MGISGIGICTWNYSPGPGPTPPSPPSSGYENPFKAPCAAGEVNMTIPEVNGAYCTPACDSATCPGVPAGFKATAQCKIKDSFTGKDYCALVCNPAIQARAMQRWTLRANL